MSVEMSPEEFFVIYEALRLANNPYTNDEVAHLVAMEAKAWTVVQEVTHRAGLSEQLPFSEEPRS